MVELADLLRSLLTVRQQKAALDKVEKSLLADVKPLVDPEFDRLTQQEEGTGVPVVADRVELYRIAGVTRTISGDLLLERGVHPEIIAYATKTTAYYQYRTKEVKDGQEAPQET